MANEYITKQLKNVRCAFAYLITPNPKAPEHYTVKLLLPKSDPQTIEFLTFMENLALQRFGDKQKAYQTGQIQDGDLPGRNGTIDDNFRGHWLINPKTKIEGKTASKYRVVDRNLKVILDPAQIYGGMWININLAIDAYKSQQYGNKFAIYMNSVQKVKDDVPFFNASATNDGFDDLDANDAMV